MWPTISRRVWARFCDERNREEGGGGGVEGGGWLKGVRFCDERNREEGGGGGWGVVERG